MEYFVNLTPEDAPGDLVAVRVEIGDDIRIERLDIAMLPESWKEYPAPRELSRIGEAWLAAGQSLCLLVPSVVIPEELNLLINPLHTDFHEIRFDPPIEFKFDPRMWKS